MDCEEGTTSDWMKLWRLISARILSRFLKWKHICNRRVQLYRSGHINSPISEIFFKFWKKSTSRGPKFKNLPRSCLWSDLAKIWFVDQFEVVEFKLVIRFDQYCQTSEIKILFRKVGNSDLNKLQIWILWPRFTPFWLFNQLISASKTRYLLEKCHFCLNFAPVGNRNNRPKKCKKIITI